MFNIRINTNSFNVERHGDHIKAYIHIKIDYIYLGGYMAAITLVVCSICSLLTYNVYMINCTCVCFVSGYKYSLCQKNNYHIIPYMEVGPMIATNIHAPMGSPWHNLLYLPLFDGFI